MCLRTLLFLFCFDLYAWNSVFAFKLFHNVYVCDGALWLDLNLLIYDLYFVFASGDFL